jgi:hypothetical protein
MSDRMLLAVFYACVFLAATAAWIWVQFGWQPPFVTLWDTRAWIYFGLLSLATAWVAAVGIVGQTPWHRLPRSLKSMPFMTASLVPAFAFIVINDFSPASTARDVLSMLGWATAMGVGLGIAAGFLSSLIPESEVDRKAAPTPKETRTRIFLTLAAIVAGGAALLLFPRARDDAGVRDFARFGNAEYFLEIGVSKGAMSDDEFGIVKITAHDKANGLVLERDQWSAISELWPKAERAQSGKWRVIGDVQDAQSSDPSRLVLVAGNGVRIVISSAHRQDVTYTLAPADFGRVDAAIAKVANTLQE